MEYFELVIKLFEVIAWPSLIFGVLFLFRSPVGELLSSAKTMGLKHNDTELNMTFEHGLDAIEIQPEAPDPSDSLEQLANKKPQVAIFESWMKVEEAAGSKSRQLSLAETNGENFAPDKALRYIENSGVFSPVIRQALTQLRWLHFSLKQNPETLVSSEKALKYIRVARVIIKQIESLTTVPQFKLTSLTYLIIQFNALLDSNKYDYISVGDIHREIENHSVLSFIAKEAGQDVDLSMVLSPNESTGFEQKYSEQLDWIYGGNAGRERKWGVENLGLCLLIAWTNEIIQQGSGWHPYENLTARENVDKIIKQSSSN